MATFAANFTSCLADNVNILSRGFGDPRFGVELKYMIFGCLPHFDKISKCLFFFVSWTPFVGCKVWSFTTGAFWLLFLFIWASFMMIALPTDETFSFGPTRFGQRTKQFQYCCTEIGVRILPPCKNYVLLGTFFWNIGWYFYESWKYLTSL